MDQMTTAAPKRQHGRRRRRQSAKIFPGFMMFWGSIARLMLRIVATAPTPAYSSK